MGLIERGALKIFESNFHRQEPIRPSFKHAITQQTFTTRLVMSVRPSARIHLN